MKKIGFIDIHPQSPPGRSHTSELSGSDQSAIYFFSGTDEGFVCEKSLDYSSSAKEWPDVDEFYVSLPASLLDFRVLTFPFADKDKITEVIPLELSTLLLNGRENIVFDSIIIRGSDTAVDVLVIYIGTEVLGGILADLRQRNIDPRIVTSIDLRSPTPDLTASEREQFLISFGSRLNNPATWDQRSRIDAAKEEISQPSFNLRKGQFAYTRDTEKTGKALQMTVVLAFLLVLIFHAGFFIQTLIAKNESASITAQMRLSYKNLFPGEKKTIDVLYQLKSHIKESRETQNILSGVAPLHLLRELSRATEANVVYTDISLEKGLIKMKAEARSMDDLAKIQKNLAGFLTGVSISDIRPAAQGKVLFTVIAKDQI